MLISLLSLKSSPGVTTFATALAACWLAPNRPLLLEADPAGGDLGARFSLRSAQGLTTLADAAAQVNTPIALRQHTQQILTGVEVLPAPADAAQAHAAVTALTSSAETLKALAEQAGTVILDCGRADASSPALALVCRSDAVILLTRACGDALAHLPHRLTEVENWTPRPLLLLIGDGYSTTEVEHGLGVPVFGRIPDDPHGAALFCGEQIQRRWGGPRAVERTPLGWVARKVAFDLSCIFGRVRQAS